MSPQQIDDILEVLNRYQVRYILIGGVNFLLNHKPLLTFDLDIWVEDNLDNLKLLNSALQEINAEWGKTDDTWGPISLTADWLTKQSVFCLLTKFGPLDVFREVRGLEGRFKECFAAANASAKTPGEVSYVSLSDRHMLECQLALDYKDQSKDKIDILNESIKKNSNKSP